MHIQSSWKSRLALLLVSLSQLTLVQWALANPTTGAGNIGG